MVGDDGLPAVTGNGEVISGLEIWGTKISDLPLARGVFRGLLSS